MIERNQQPKKESGSNQRLIFKSLMKAMILIFMILRQTGPSTVISIINLQEITRGVFPTIIPTPDMIIKLPPMTAHKLTLIIATRDSELCVLKFYL
jgi:hypothetical protein